MSYSQTTEIFQLPSNPLLESCSPPQWLLLFHIYQSLPGYFLLQFPTEKYTKPLPCYLKMVFSTLMSVPGPPVDGHLTQIRR